MRTRRLALLAGLCLAAAGCATDTTGADEMLAGAHGSLEAGNVTTARQWLDGALPRLENARQRKEYELLLAEADIRSGDADLAAGAMRHLLEQDPDDPRVHELAGKADLMQGDFAAAGDHFDIARGRYAGEADAARAGDLMVMAQGFEAYSQGRIAAARDTWLGIRDRQLRAGILGASGEAAEPALITQSTKGDLP